MAKLTIIATQCDDPAAGFRCPHHYTTRIGGYGEDYRCKVMGGKITSGYVEWPSEVNPIPSWCPLLKKNIKKANDKDKNGLPSKKVDSKPKA